MNKISRSNLVAPLIAPPNVARCTSAEERLIGVDEESLAERFAAEEHPEPHLIAVREGRLGGDGVAAQLDIDEHYEAIFVVA